MGLNQKLYDIMCETESLEKDLVVGKGTKGEYKAVGEATVLNMVKPLFKKYKIICLPKDGTIQEHTTSFNQYGKESFRAVTQLKTYFTLIDIESGEERDIVGFGNGADSQDKGSGKAFTYAYKTALQKAFCLFSGEDTDNTHSDEITGNQNTVTVKMLEEAMQNKGITAEQVIKTYKEETGKDCTELKFITQDKKQEYYERMNK